jgi:hypothetical protein
MTAYRARRPARAKPSRRYRAAACGLSTLTLRVTKVWPPGEQVIPLVRDSDPDQELAAPAPAPAASVS